MFRFLQIMQGKTKLRFYPIGLLLLLAPTLLLPLTPTRVTAENNAPQIDWLEPRGLSIVSLVGLVPEAHLKDAIIAYRPGYGLIQYVSGQRNGNSVTINTRMTPRYLSFGGQVLTTIGCLGQQAVYDEWPGAVPPTQMRVFANGAEITSQAVYAEYIYAGQIPPVQNAGSYERYDKYKGAPEFAANGALNVPANMGCLFNFSGRHSNVTAQFTFEDAPRIQVTAVGSESFTFHSYIGEGNTGQMGSLNQQMHGRFGNRHDKFALNPPAGTEYFLLKFPPQPVEPYPSTMPEVNVTLAASGSYRIARSDNTLSVDHSASMLMPLYGQWQDADQSGGEFLRFFKDATRLAVPEYFVPVGIGYNSCMTSGGCSADLLTQIYNTEMTLTIYYYRVDRIADGLTRIPLQQVGPSWRRSAVQSAEAASSATTLRQRNSTIYMPVVTHQPQPTPAPQLPPDDKSGCPCGWFDGYGRMLDFIAP